MSPATHRPVTAALRLAAAFALAAACGPAHALALGGVEVGSALGEPLEARIAVTAAPGEALRGACFSMAPQARQGPLAGATLELRHHRGGADLLVHGRSAVSQPSIALAITIACPGSSVPSRQVQIPIPLQPRAAPLEAVAPPAAEGVAAPATGGIAAPHVETITTLPVQPGDTLGGIARDIFPGNRAAREDYLAAMREANPPLRAFGDDAELPANATVALPDLRTFPRRAHKPRIEVASSAAPPRATANRAALPPVAQRPAPAPRERLAVRSDSPPRAASAPAPATRPRLKVEAPPAGFQLKLSGPVMDLSPTRKVSEAERARLRQQLRVLDADDRMAALLAMREQIRRLEGEVSELRLKIAQAPASMPAAPSRTHAPAPPAPVPVPTPHAPAPAVSARPAPAPPAPAVAKPPVPTTPAREPSPPKPPAPAGPALEASRSPTPAASPQPTARASTETAATMADAKKESPATPRVVAPPPESAASWYGSTWLVAAALALVLAALAVLLWRRFGPSAAEPEALDAQAESGGEDSAPEESTEFLIAEEIPTPAPAEAQQAAAVLEVPEWTDTTRFVADGETDLRQRYLEERFPEIVSGVLVMDDPASVVKVARLLCEDGAVARAVELLQLAVERDPGQAQTWLALFEIFRRERLAGEFATLARRFAALPGPPADWPKVQAAGHEIDPRNTLYGASAQPFDAAAENWLQVPAQAGGEALAAELRGGLMEGASLTERDLAADPTPALRKSESFSVA